MLTAIFIAFIVFLVWFLVARPIGELKVRLTYAETAIRELKAQLQQTGGTLTSTEHTEEEAQPAEPEEQLPAAAPAEPAPLPTAVPITTTSPPERAAEPPGSTAASAPSFEEWVGTRWAVWVGGTALAVGGIFLVNYSIEAGLLGPETRIVLATLFAIALICAGEWMRRQELALPFDIVPSANVPGILTAAGTVALFGTIYAAYALYGFIGAGTAFVLLGAAGLATMLAAALHGGALAGIGLVGAMMTPLLVSSSEPSPWPLVVFLAVVSASAFALARLRHWLWLGLASVFGVMTWGLAIAQPIGPTWDSAAYVHTLIQLGLTAAFFAIEPHVPTPDSRSKPDFVSRDSSGSAYAPGYRRAGHNRRNSGQRHGVAAVLGRCDRTSCGDGLAIGASCNCRRLLRDCGRRSRLPMARH